MEGMEKQLTAVGWLEYHYKKQMEIHGEINSILLDDLFETAKQMEKQQIIGTYINLKIKNNKLPYGIKYLSKLASVEEEAEQYYNETYNSERIEQIKSE